MSKNNFGEVFQKYLYLGRNKFKNINLAETWAESKARHEVYDHDPLTVYVDNEPLIENDRLVRTPEYKTFMSKLAGSD